MTCSNAIYTMRASLGANRIQESKFKSQDSPITNYQLPITNYPLPITPRKIKPTALRARYSRSRIPSEFKLVCKKMSLSFFV